MQIKSLKTRVLAAAIFATSLIGAAPDASARSDFAISIGPDGFGIIVDSRVFDDDYRDVRRAERRLAREERQLDRAIRRGAPRWVIREERRDVRRARRALRRERRDLW